MDSNALKSDPRILLSFLTLLFFCVPSLAGEGKWKGYKRLALGLDFASIPDACSADRKREASAKSPAIAGAKSSEHFGRAAIHGPANLRDAPEGKLIGSLPDQMDVFVEAQKNEWYYVRLFQPRQCETGWTHAKNLQPAKGPKLSAEEIALMKSLEEEYRGIKFSGMPQTVKMKQECTCIGLHDGFGGSADEAEFFRFPKGKELGRECTLNEGGASRCVVDPVTDYPFGIYCPSKCVDSKTSTKLTAKEKDAFLDFEVNRIRPLIKRKLPSALLDAVSNRFPSWLPIVFLRRSLYALKLEGALTGLTVEFTVEDQIKKRAAMIFYANIEDRNTGIPTIAFEGNGSPRFQRVPFSIDDHQHDPMRNICLMVRGSFVKVGAASFDAAEAGLDDGVAKSPMKEESFWLELSNTKANPEDRKVFGMEQVSGNNEEDARYRLNRLMFESQDSIRVSCFEIIQ